MKELPNPTFPISQLGARTAFWRAPPAARVASAVPVQTVPAAVPATEAAAATSFTLDVDALAKSQSISSASQALGSLVGAGTLTFRLGTWSGGAADAAAANAAIAVADANVASTAGAASTAATNASNALNAFTSGSTEAAAYQASNRGVLALATP